MDEGCEEVTVETFSDYMKKVYRGFLKLDSNGEEEDILALGEAGWLAEIIMDDMAVHGHFLTVRYFTADKEMTEEQLIEGLLKKLYGEGDVDYGMAYSECTGYLWTDEKLNVGGHDLLGELKNAAGKFLHLEIEYSEKATPV